MKNYRIYKRNPQNLKLHIDYIQLLRYLTTKHMKTLTAKNQPRKRQLHSEYGVISPIATPKDQSIKLLKRKPEKKVEKVHNGMIQRRKSEKLIDIKQVCYISHNSFKQIPMRIQRSTSQSQGLEVQNNLQPRKKRVTSSPPTRSAPKTLQVISKGFIMTEVRTKTAEQNEKLTIQNLKSEIKQLKNANIILTAQINSIKKQKNQRNSTIQNLHEKIQNLSQSLRESKKTIKDYESEIFTLRQRLDEESSKLSSLRIQLEGQKLNFSKKKPILMESPEKEELQRMLSDINRGFDEIFVDSKMCLHQEEYIPETQSNILQQDINFNKQSQEQIIYNLHDKIKYLQIEVSMLKRYKFQFQKLEKEYDKFKIQMKGVNKKFMRLEQQRVKNAEKQKQKQREKSKGKESTKQYPDQYSISFDLSKDQTTNGE